MCQLTAQAPGSANLASQSEKHTQSHCCLLNLSSHLRHNMRGCHAASSGSRVIKMQLLTLRVPLPKASFSTSPWFKTDRFSPVALRCRITAAAAVCGSNFPRMRTTWDRSRLRCALRRTHEGFKGTVRGTRYWRRRC